MSPNAVGAAAVPKSLVTTTGPELIAIRTAGRTPYLAISVGAIAASRSWINSAARHARSGPFSSASGTPNIAMIPSPAKSWTEPLCSLTAPAIASNTDWISA